MRIYTHGCVWLSAYKYQLSAPFDNPLGQVLPAKSYSPSYLL